MIQPRLLQTVMYSTHPLTLIVEVSSNETTTLGPVGYASARGIVDVVVCQAELTFKHLHEMYMCSECTSCVIIVHFLNCLTINVQCLNSSD